jgi:hypothetical protein
LSVPLRMWFDPAVLPDRRKQENRLRRIALDAERQDESQIERWLDLGDVALRDAQENEERGKKRRGSKAA